MQCTVIVLSEYVYQASPSVFLFPRSTALSTVVPIPSRTPPTLAALFLPSNEEEESQRGRSTSVLYRKQPRGDH